MVTVGHSSRSPDVPQLLQVLELHVVRYVLTGSVAASMYGVDVQPGDLDITPALDRENLCRLATVLETVEAAIDGGEGRWEQQPNGEQTWIEQELTVRERSARAAAWRPDPDDVSTFDHLFRSCYGSFDVVPRVTGAYETLIQRALLIEMAGCRVWVAHVDDLLATLTIPRRQKDIARVHALRGVQRKRGIQSP